MNGPEHYAAAEKAFIKAQRAGAEMDGASASLYIQAAQYHAIMALAAATALPGSMQTAWNVVFGADSQTTNGSL